jgi:hypothetical protein
MNAVIGNIGRHSPPWAAIMHENRPFSMRRDEMNLFEWIFKLPPTSERFKRAPYHHLFIDSSRGASIEQNDCYIFYLAARNTFVVGTAFAIVIAVFYFSGADIRDIELYGYPLEKEPGFLETYRSTRMKGFVYFYTYWMANFIWVATIYNFLLYVINVDPKMDVLRGHLKLRYKNERTPWGLAKFVLLILIGGFGMMFLGTYFSYGLFETILRFRLLDIEYDNAKSEMFFIVHMGFLLVALPLVSMLLTAASGMLYGILLGRHRNGGL